MTAMMRFDVTDRNEKGYGKLSSKRLFIIAALAGAAAVLVGGSLGLLRGGIAGAAAFVTALALSTPRRGMPLVSLLLREAQGRLIVAALAPETASPPVRLAARLLRADADLGRLYLEAGAQPEPDTGHPPDPLAVHDLSLPAYPLVMATGLDPLAGVEEE